MSQRALARRLGVDQSTLAGWEQGRQRPSRELWERLATRTPGLDADPTGLDADACREGRNWGRQRVQVGGAPEWPSCDVPALVRNRRHRGGRGLDSGRRRVESSSRMQP